MTDRLTYQVSWKQMLFVKKYLYNKNLKSILNSSRENHIEILFLQDLLSYIVSIETVDTLSGYFQLVRNPIDSSPEVADFLLVALQFLSSLTG